MKDDLFKEYKINSKVDRSLIDKYKEKILTELLYIWEVYGFGSILNGDLKIVNPEEYQSVVDMSYFRANISIPIMITGFGDIITWEKMNM